MGILKAVVICLGLIFGEVDPAEAQEKEILVMDRFLAGADEKGLPKGWLLEGDLDPKQKISLEKEKENYFLHLLCANDSSV